MVIFGGLYGGYHWIVALQAGIATPAGTVMVAALPILLGLQLILAFFNYDISSVPKRPLHSAIVVRRQWFREATQGCSGARGTTIRDGLESKSEAEH
jgi:hypothetical protein